MTYSFIGLGKPIAAVNNLLKASIKNYRKDHPGQIPILTPGGIFASDLTNAAAFAGDNDMCVYMTIEELLKNSDLVFVFINDKALKSISLTLGKHGTKGKIFCHFSPAFSADILDFNSANTYISMLLPYITRDTRGRNCVNHIIAEGYGRNIEPLKDIFSMLKINISFISREEKLLYLTGASLAKDMPLILKHASKKLIKYALASNPDLSEELMNLAFDDSAVLNTYNITENPDIDFIQNQCSALKSLGIDDITNLYSVLLGIVAEIPTSLEVSQKISQIAKRTLQQK